MNKTYELTQEGYNKLKEELADLVDNQRGANRTALAEARAQGDLSENADYDAARNDQAKIEGRISEIEYIMKNARVIKISDDDIVDLGKYVTISNLETNKESTYYLVGTLEANPFTGQISNASALGRAISGKIKNDVVSYASETGHQFTVKIIDVFNTAK